MATPHPPAGPLPRDRTEGDNPFSVIGVDFTGPVKYLQRKSKKEQKAYIVIYSCSLTRAVFLELLPSLETGEFYQKPQTPDSEKREADKDLLRQRENVHRCSQLVEKSTQR